MLSDHFRVKHGQQLYRHNCTDLMYSMYNSLQCNQTVDCVHYVAIAVMKRETGFHSFGQLRLLPCEMKVNNLCLWSTLLSLEINPTKL